MSSALRILAAAAYALLLLTAAILRPEHRGFVALGLVVPAFAMLGPWLLRRTLSRRQDAVMAERSFPAHAPEQIKATLKELSLAAEPDVPMAVDYLIHQAVMMQGSDIHLVPYREFTAVRFRVDGILSDVAELGTTLKQPVINRLKVLSQAVTYIHDKPQDGRFDVKVGGRPMDVRIAFMPTLHGERIVMRLLNRAEVELGLASLGMTDAQYASVTNLITRPQGMIILTGPAGSGKTTTIYCSLRTILDRNRRSSSIYTLEDPIEYDLLNINQTQISEAQGFTFASGLRTMLRQDPDVIMVGEIRALETARIAVQAGMPGHLIITTVHAKRAVGAFMRLIEMGVDRHSVASAVTALLAQRLVRVLCPRCRRPQPATPGQEARLSQRLTGTFFGPAGCPDCGMKGYLGRRGVFEILEVDEAVRRLVTEMGSPEALHRAAIQQGMTTLVGSGLELARKGETSLDEVIRILPPQEELR
jgi:type II secretory ATPase GspE/PulE/Tfp pilus assembly ATPase PilB-like protein